MKKLILSAAFTMLGTFSYAQNTNIDSLKKYLKFEKDKFRNDLVVITAKDSISGVSQDKFTFVIQPTSRSYNAWMLRNFKEFQLKIGCMKMSCVDDQSSIDYVLDNGDKFGMVNMGQANCFGLFMNSWEEMSGYYKNLKKLSEGKIKAIRLNSRLSATEIYLTDQQSALLYSQIKCFKYYYDNKKEVDKLKLW